MKIQPEGDNSSQNSPGMQLQKSVLLVRIFNISSFEFLNWGFFFSVCLFVCTGKELYIAAFFFFLNLNICSLHTVIEVSVTIVKIFQLI